MTSRRGTTKWEEGEWIGNRSGRARRSCRCSDRRSRCTRRWSSRRWTRRLVWRALFSWKPKDMKVRSIEKSEVPESLESPESSNPKTRDELPEFWRIPEGTHILETFWILTYKACRSLCASTDTMSQSSDWSLRSTRRSCTLECNPLFGPLKIVLIRIRVKFRSTCNIRLLEQRYTDRWAVDDRHAAFCDSVVVAVICEVPGPLVDVWQGRPNCLV